MAAIERVSETQAGADWTDVVEFFIPGAELPVVEVKKVNRPSHRCPWQVTVFDATLGASDAYDSKHEALRYAREVAGS
jgi:hypothetical protein